MITRMYIIRKIFRNERNLRIIPIILSLIIIALSCFNIYINYPTPKLDVGMFPYDLEAAVYPFARAHGSLIYPNGTIPNESVPTQNTTSVIMGDPYSIYNFTFQVFNSGKGTAYNVNVTLRGEPSEHLKVISTNVYVGEPLQSNLLRTTKSGYTIGLLGPGKGYTFMFQVEVHFNEQWNFESGKYILTVTSDNAGTHTRHLVFV